jgi:glycosyltransferase involved in cell wall biosynthesis
VEHSLIEGRDIIITGQQPWDVEIGSNCKNIAIEFSKKNRVLYVNSPLDRITFIKHERAATVRKRIRIIKGKENGIEKLNDNFYVLYPDVLIESINWIPNHYIFDKLNYRNNKLFANSIKKAIDQLGFSNYILFNDNDIFRCLFHKELLQPAVSVYYFRDFMMEVNYWKRHGKYCEPQIIGKSDICISNSHYLIDICKKYNPNSHFAGQGCDVALFQEGSKAAKPKDIATIQSPVLGYVGALQSLRLDIGLIKKIAVALPGWNIVLVGNEDEDFKSSDLHQLPNVYFTGSKDMDDLPAYINAFDVCFNPQIVNKTTVGNYPRKIDEYLSLGKPTVVTATLSMEDFRDYIYIANSPEEYIELIQKARNENSEGKINQRKAFAETHTWENHVNKIYELISYTEREFVKK